MGLGVAVETRQHRGCLERWIDDEPGGTSEALADKERGKRGRQ